MSTLHSRRSFLKGATALTVGALCAPHVSRAIAQTDPGYLKVRRNASLMQPGDPFFSDYAEAVQALHDTRFEETGGWRVEALTHLDHCPHGAADFAAWHRHYITYFETLCGELIGKQDFALAYWDWTANMGRLPAPFFANGALNVTFWNDPSDAQSSNWSPFPVTTVGTRALNVTTGLQDDPVRGGAFTPENIASIQRLPTFDFFQQRLEGSPHNNAHVLTGGNNGHMSSGMSPLDPAFWLHHCNVDRLWAEWQAAGNTVPDLSRNYDNQFLLADGSLATGVTANNARDFRALGFTYDTLAETLVGMNDLFEFPAGGNESLLQAIPIGRTEEIGKLEANATVRPLIATDLNVTTEGLVTSLFQPRTFRPTGAPTQESRVAVSESRIIARLSGVTAKGPVTQLVTNVFVNCPYLSPETPYDDPHYADTFSFFMPAGDGAMHHDRTFVVDITDPIRRQAGQGRISTEDIQVQLMPVPVGGNPDMSADASYEVREVEIFAV